MYDWFSSMAPDRGRLLHSRVKCGYILEAS